MLWQPSTRIWTPPYRGPVVFPTRRQQMRYSAAAPVARRRTIGGGSSVAGTPPASNPDAFWRMENVNDSSGNSLTLTNTGTVTFTAGQIGNAGTFDGLGGMKLSHADDALLNATSKLSVCFWLKMTTNGQPQHVFEKGYASTSLVDVFAGGVSGGTPYSLDWRVGNGTVRAKCGGIFTALSSATWYFFCFTFDNSLTAPNNLGGSKNGAAFTYPAADNSIAAANTSTSAFNIGNDAFSQALQGQLDAFGWWNNYALTDANALYLYNGGVGREFAAGVWS